MTKPAWVGAVMLGVFLVLGVCGPWIAPIGECR